MRQRLYLLGSDDGEQESRHGRQQEVHGPEQRGVHRLGIRGYGRCRIGRQGEVRLLRRDKQTGNQGDCWMQGHDVARRQHRS